MYFSPIYFFLCLGETEVSIVLFAHVSTAKKAKRARFLKEYWGVRHGNNQNSRVPPMGKPKTSQDVAEAVGTNAKHLGRLLKLNDLIPELQDLVSSKKLGALA